MKAAAEGDQDSLAIIQAIVTMAQGLGMTTTAEGVETEAERELVRRLGCSQIQGFLVGRPERRETPPPVNDVNKAKEISASIPPTKRRAVRGR